jgi:hypothetical protein
MNEINTVTYSESSPWTVEWLTLQNNYEQKDVLTYNRVNFCLIGNDPSQMTLVTNSAGKIALKNFKADVKSCVFMKSRLIKHRGIFTFVL